MRRPKERLQRQLKREDFELGRFMWLVAEAYKRDQDQCIVVEKIGEPKAYAPLEDPELFFSFAGLAARGKPSDNSILRWVGGRGLPEAREENARVYTSNGELNQADMSIEDLAARAIEAHSALNLHADLAEGDARALVKRVEKLQKDQKHWKQLSDMDKRLVEDWSEGADSNGLFWRAEIELMTFVSRETNQVRPALVGGSSFLDSSTKGYRPTQGWKCPDLLSGMYLQFYLLVTGSQPMRRCEKPSCEMPFPLTRKDKRFCSSSCRSGMRHHR